MSHSSRMTSFFAGLSYDDIPEDVRRLARVSLLDTLGVILAGQAFLEHEGDGRLERYLSAHNGAEDATALGFQPTDAAAGRSLRQRHPGRGPGLAGHHHACAAP